MHRIHLDRLLLSLFLVTLLAGFAEAEAKSGKACALSLAEPPGLMFDDLCATSDEGDASRRTTPAMTADSGHEPSSLVMASSMSPVVRTETPDIREQFAQPPMIDTVSPNWLSEWASQRRSGAPARMLMGHPASQLWNESGESKAGESPGSMEVATGRLNVDGVNVGAAWAVFERVTPHRQDVDAHEDFAFNPIAVETRRSEHYHWDGLLAQSLFFNVIENSFRAASDDQIRTLLSSKPFWHDYAASIKHFNMRRWNDGDDFLVNYVGHPMQGAVSGFIEIQNDPGGRDLKIAANHNYWESRFKAFLWAVAYSTHSEISPLGESGIGNEGGWTYPLHCKTRCVEPGTYKHYTNNTGWVDFTITPTVGTLWLLAEDTLDRYVSDRIQGDNRSRILPKIIRGGLNPSRTMANALRFKTPWYRDSQQSPELDKSYGMHFLPSDEELAAAREFRRFSIAPYFHSMPFGSPSKSCFLCFENPGMGIAFEYGWARWIGASIAMEKEANSLVKGGSTTGSTLSLGFGLRLVYDRPNNSLSFAVRPGVMLGQVALASGPEANDGVHARQFETIGHGFITLALSNDVKVNRLLSMRVSIADTIFRYSNADGKETGIGSPPYLSWLSKQDYKNESTWSSEIGPVLRF
jgi:hypothetical protein